MADVDRTYDAGHDRDMTTVETVRGPNGRQGGVPQGRRRGQRGADRHDARRQPAPVLLV